MKTIYLFRHSQTDVLRDTMLGHWDVPLNEKGIELAHETARYYQHCGIEGIICSNLQRAFQTATIFSEYWKVPVFETAILRERDQGEYDSLKLEAIYEKQSDFSLFTKGDKRETVKMLMSRSKEAIEMIENSFCWDRFAIVSHNGLLRTIFAVCLKMTVTGWPWCECKIIEREPGKEWHYIER